MTSRIPLLAVALLASLPGASSAAAPTLREQSQAVVEARGYSGLKVENPRGLVLVRASRDGRIHVTALKLATASEPSRARHFADLTRVETSNEGGRYVIRVRYPQRQTVRVSVWRFLKGEFEFPGVEVRLEVDVPPAFPVDLETASGDLETQDLTGSQTLASASGDIDVRGSGALVSVSTTSGNVGASGLSRARIRSVSGDVTVDGARGTLDVATTSGDIEVRGAADSLNLSSISGDVRVDHAPRGIEAATTSGSVTLEGLAAGVVKLRSTSGDIQFGLGRGLRRADAGTVSGDIELSLADDVGCTLDIRSSSGDLDSSVPLQIRTVTRHQMSGVVRGGGPSVTLHSTSGAIAVTGGGR